LTPPASITETMAFCCQFLSGIYLLVVLGVTVAKYLFGGVGTVVLTTREILVAAGSRSIKFEIIVTMYTRIFCIILIFSTVLFDSCSSASKLVKVLSFTTAAEYTRERAVKIRLFTEAIYHIHHILCNEFIQNIEKS
jgi:hypothetical protein